MKFPRYVLVFFLFMVGVPAAAESAPATTSAASPSPLAARTLLLANSAVPESLALAKEYAALRGIPESHVIALDLPSDQTITHAAFEEKVVAPLRRTLIERELISVRPRLNILRGERTLRHATRSSRISIVCTFYGVPLRVADRTARVYRALQHRAGLPDRRANASLDAELALLLIEPRSPSTPFINPDYNAWIAPLPSRDGQFILQVSRLDGPSPDIVRNMIQGALHAERYGLQGRAVIDLVGHQNLSDPYTTGDLWMRRFSETLLSQGYDVLVQQRRTLIEPDYPLEHVAWYAGWYAEHVTGPFALPEFRFAPGAFAYHLHSFSAGDIRDPARHWVGPLLARGAAASMGSVDEPYLHLTPQPDIVADRLTRSYPFADAAHFSQRELSWQNTFLGDPLFRPFVHSLDTQIRHLEADNHPALPWAYLRQINIHARSGRLNLALDLARQRIQQTRSTLLTEKLADLYAENGMHDEALLEYQALLPAVASPESAFRIAGKMIEVLRATLRTTRIPPILETLSQLHPNHRCLPWLIRLAQLPSP